MTIREAIAQIDEMKPNTYSTTVKIRWLSQLDSGIWEDLIRTHEGGEGTEWHKYTEADMDTELLAHEPHDVMYVHWLESRIDYYNSEYGHFNNSNAAFNADYEDYDHWYRMNHMPIGKQIKYF